MNSLKKKKQDILWGKKWRNLIQQKAIKEEMNKQLKASLEKQKQEEEEKECTFKPQTLWNQSFKKTISFVDEFFVKLKPYIEQQQAYLNQLKELERDDELFAQKIKASEEHTRINTNEELRTMLAKAVDKEIMESIIEGYKAVRTRGINKVKRERLDILSKMIKLERAYNCFMAKENVDKKDLGECGFDCDLAAKLRNDILKNSLCPNSLRDFARIRLEINQVLEEELHKRENEKESLFYSTKGDNNELSRSEADYTSRYAAFVNSSKETSQESIPCAGDNRVAGDGVISMGEPYQRKALAGGTATRLHDGSVEACVGGASIGVDLGGSFAGHPPQAWRSAPRVPPPEGCQVVTPTRNAANGGSAFYEDGQMNESRIGGREQRIGSHEPRIGSHEPLIGTHEPQGAMCEYTPQMENMSYYPISTVDAQKRSNKNVYLNSNYTAILKNEDAHKYVSSLQKDSSSVNVIIMNNSGAKSVISGGGTKQSSRGGSFANSPLRSGAYYYGRDEEKPTYMDLNHMNRSGNFDQAQQRRGSVSQGERPRNVSQGERPRNVSQGEKPRNVSQVGTHKGEFPSRSSMGGSGGMDGRSGMGGRVERKNTRYVDKNTYAMRNENNFYDVDGMKNKQEEGMHQMNPFYRNNLVHAAQQEEDILPVGVGEGRTTLGNSPHYTGDSRSQGGHPDRPLLRKIMDRFAIL
ncbi:hypothetical protein PCYB_102630 [Plasmodium cynomolgi strain B]|uniref:Uncharacterized protein n=1 Tax=Plasmodium cynomolgi (strain B) TaxID=1120755 RepID=K6UKK7_PLACD|nr:hypothetical protein PCYB_102630 [Plasmodium cynomolgi strain B]GAB66913.1 hypothetical protein PCYB_102630 [Plasmodium cynomolgi strain B]